MVEQKKKIKINIDHSENAFYTDNFTISHGPRKFVIDFTQTVPKFDVIEGDMHQTMNVKHKTVLLDPHIAKELVSRLKENVGRFEKNFVKIPVGKKPKSKKTSGKVTTVADPSTRYIG